jgi:hypothetical protein
MKWLFIPLLALTLASSPSWAQGHFYRYVNDEGVKVLGHSIPPELVHKGYEIISPTGRVLQTIEPAPPPAELEKERALAELEVKYEMLAKRYSTERDIEAAKSRKLVHIDASILLVQSSIESVQAEINDLTRRAADFERAGQVVPQNILSSLAVLNDKMAATKAILSLREGEKQTILDRFSQERELFLSRGDVNVLEAEVAAEASSTSMSSASSASSVSSESSVSSVAVSQ